MKAKLTHQSIIKLINLYRSYPVLWDMNHKSYRSNDLKSKAYEEIAKEMFMDAEIVRRKIRCLRITYTSEKRKMKMQKSGSGTEENYVPSLKWFDEMSFLDSSIVARKAIDNSVENNLNSMSCEEFEDSKYEEHFENNTPKCFEDNTSNKLDEALENPLEEKESEFVAFGTCIAKQLQNVPVEIAYELMGEIQNTITKRKIKYVRESRRSMHNCCGNRNSEVSKLLLLTKGMEVKKMPNSSAGRKQPTAVSRMKQDYMRLKRDPLPYITAEPLPNNILEWHYVVKGPEDSPYYGGYYHGTLLFPREFPFKPPSIYMLTPNGRFKTNTRLCLSISDFHPDTWNPTWCVGTILTGLLSFMLESTATLGSIETTNYEKQQLAKKSLAFNLKNPHFVELFPEICEEINKRLQTEKEQKLKALNAAANGTIANGTNGLKATANGVAGVGGIKGCIPVNGTTANINDANGGIIADPNSAKSLSNSYLNWQSNIIIVICFAIFVLVVNYVFKNINQE